MGRGATWLSFLASTQEGAVAVAQVPSPPLSAWRPPGVPASSAWGLGGQRCWCNWFGQHTGPERVPDSTAPALGLLLQCLLGARQQQGISTRHVLGFFAEQGWATQAREQVSTDEGPHAGTWAVESQRGIKASRKESVPALGPAAGQPGRPAEQQYSYCALGASARPSGRTEVLYVSLQPCVHGVSARHRPGHNRVLQAGLQGSSVLAEKLLSRSLSFAVPSCP